MTENLVTKAKKIHFIGIGGIGVSALAKICHYQKKIVTGSDLNQNDQFLELKNLGLTLSLGHDVKNLQSPDLVIYSLAIPKNNPELLSAKEQGITTLSYPEALGEITKSYKLIAIAGSHGKTTSTGMLAKILIDKGLDPTVIIGSTANFLDNQNFRVGKSDYFVLEACEYYAGFLNLKPYITLITNLEHDHFDAYPTEKSYLDAFQKLIDQSINSVVNLDFPLSNQLKLNQQTQTFKSDSTKKIPLGIPGIHNQTNANGVIEVCQLLNISNAGTPLSTFTGTGRRLQIVKQTDSKTIYDDYGHHPTEIRATLQAIKEKHPKAKICLIYQAHQHNRTIALLPEFKNSFAGYDQVIIPDIYAARDSIQEKQEMDAEKFAQELNAKYLPTIYTDSQVLAESTKNFDIIVIMGAGDVYTKIENNIKNTNLY